MAPPVETVVDPAANGKHVADGKAYDAPAGSSLTGATPEDYDTGERPSKVYSSNPLVAFVQWLLSFTIPGLGMFSEAYFIFSIGNLSSIFAVEYPKCFGTKHPNCSYTLTNSTTYTQIAGIMAGMIFLGFFADRLGRKLGSIITASIMTLGGIMLACSDGPDQAGIVWMYTISQLIFGIGVGGEYPIASSSAAERAEADKNLVAKRGETVILVFSNQGLGNVVNVCVLLILLACFHQGGPHYDPTYLDWVWRLSFVIGLIPVLIMLYIRIFRLKESSIWLAKRNNLKKEGLRTSFGFRKIFVLLYHYWHRLAGTALSWFVWDVAFYGNKLFQSTFIKIIIGGTPGLILTLEYTLLNAVIAYIGYFFAAFTIDRRWMGRTRMQIMGFAFIFVLFLLCSIYYNSLISKKYIGVFEFLYFFSSFWGQWGPNSTTWLLPGEVFPTETRAFAHGIAAATGKAGALTAGIVFQHVTNQTKFTVTTICAGIGLALTILFVPDLTGLDLREADARWVLLLEGRGRDYHGPAVNWKNLSLFEWLIGYARHYDPKAPKAPLGHITEKVVKGVKPTEDNLQTI